jgi:hypothetical protein
MYYGPIKYPKFVIRFFKQYLKELWPASLLAPFVNDSDFIAPLSDLDSVRRAVVAAESDAQVLSPKLLQSVEVLTEKPLPYLTKTTDVFDAVVAALPFGARYRGEVPKGFEGLRNDHGDFLLLASAKRLSDEGAGLFLTTPSFMYAKDRGLLNALNEQGLYVDAALSLPTGTLRPYTNIATLLVIIKRQKPERLFVGELRENVEQQAVLLNNLKRRKQGEEPQLGALVDESEFVTLDAYIIKHELRRAAARAKLTSVPIAELTEEINRFSRSGEVPFEDKPNSVYLPLIGVSSAVTSLEEATVKPQNLYQLVLKPGVVSAAFLARFLNTALGRKWRRSLEQVATIPQIRLGTLRQSEIYLPLDSSLHQQMLETDAKISEAIAQLTQLQRSLWETPGTAKKIRKQLDSMVRLEGQSFEAWVETLPFPLASILWAYHAEQEPKERVEHLFHFFEALAVFTASLLISGFRNDPDFYEEQKSDLEEKDERFKDWSSAASFGNWVIYAERLAKQLRQLMSDKDKREETLRNFGEPDPDFLAVLLDKELYKVLKEANELRDSWKGHGPKLTSEQSQTVLAQLETLLSLTLKVTSDRYEGAALLLPISSRFQKGIHVYKAHALTGPKTPFRQISVKTLRPMEEGRLHLLQQDKLYPLPILPFIRLGLGPEQQPKTTYFYSRLTEKGARYVAYQFSDEPESYFRDPEVMEALSLIIKSDST